MIISQTPLRISFVGGGSDLPAFFRKEPGAVVSATINKYIYITVNKKFDGKVRASYAMTEIVDHPRQLKHELIREALKVTGIKGGIEITSISDIPSEGTGLGSSSSYTVGLLNALWAYQGKHASAETLARTACTIELARLKKQIGKQDQYAASYGGLLFMEYTGDGRVTVRPIICKPKTKSTLEEGLLLFYTGITRTNRAILAEQSNTVRTSINHRVTTRKMATLARNLRDALQGNDVSGFSTLLHENWLLKKTLASGISSARIDEWYERARQAGALGGKIVGAGGGGFLLFFAPKNRHKSIIKELADLKYTPFAFEPQGSRIIYVG